MGLLYRVRNIRLGRLCHPIGCFETTNKMELPMTVPSKAPESSDRLDDLDDPTTGCSSPQVIEFFAAREQMIADQHGCAQPFRRRQETKNISRRELLHPLSDPLEDWLNSLITGAALVSLLIGILCWPSFTTTKPAGTKLLPISHTESFLITQKPE
jgi:hypothetical protein